MSEGWNPKPNVGAPLTQDGGKKKQQKKIADKKQQDKKALQKKQEKQSQKEKQSKKQDKQDKQSQRQKKGGAFVDDVKNLAVPFAILLAKEGLSKVFDKSSKSKKTTLSASSAKKPSSTRRRTMAGGSCNLGCQAGGAAQELVKLQNQIDNFLNKY